MKRINLGVIGMGMAFERLHYPALQKMQDKYNIAAICDSDGQKVDNWQKTLGLNKEDLFTDYHELLKRNDLDAFLILVPISLNYQITEDVAKIGKAIICEKPLAPDLNQARKARKLPRKYNVPIMIAENYRYNEENNIIKELIENEEIGEVHYFIQNRSVNFPEDMLQNNFAAKEWRQHPNYPGGAILDAGIHDIGALHHIFGGVKYVHACGVSEAKEFSPYLVVQSNLIFESGLTGQFTFFSSGKEMQRPLIGLRIFGSKGMIYLEERNCGTVNVAYNDGGSKQIPYQPQQGYQHELLNFYKALNGDETISVTPEQEFGDAMAIFAIVESAKKNTIVKL